MVQLLTHCADSEFQLSTTLLLKTNILVSKRNFLKFCNILGTFSPILLHMCINGYLWASGENYEIAIRSIVHDFLVWTNI